MRLRIGHTPKLMCFSWGCPCGKSPKCHWKKTSHSPITIVTRKTYFRWILSFYNNLSIEKNNGPYQKLLSSIFLKGWTFFWRYILGKNSNSPGKLCNLVTGSIRMSLYYHISTLFSLVLLQIQEAFLHACHSVEDSPFLKGKKNKGMWWH